MRTNEAMRERRQVGQEVGDGAAGESKRWVRRVGIGETARAKDVETNEYLDMRHVTELAGPNASQDLLGAVVENVIVVLDEMAADLSGATDQRLQFLKGRGDRLLHDDVGASIERVHGEPEVRGRRGGDVDHVGSSLLQHGPVVGEPGSDAIPLGGSLGGRGRTVADGDEFDAGQGLQASQMLPGDLPGSDERCLHEPTSRIRRWKPSNARAAPLQA